MAKGGSTPEGASSKTSGKKKKKKKKTKGGGVTKKKSKEQKHAEEMGHVRQEAEEFRICYNAMFYLMIDTARMMPCALPHKELCLFRAWVVDYVLEQQKSAKASVVVCPGDCHFTIGCQIARTLYTSTRTRLKRKQSYVQQELK